MAANARTRETIKALDDAVGSRPFSVQEARNLGVTDDQLQHAVAVGLLTRVKRGWYAVTHRDPRHIPANVQAAIAHCLDRGYQPVVAGDLALEWWQLDHMGPARKPLLLVDPTSGIRRGVRNGVLIRHAELPPSHVVTSASGVRYTSSLRTGIDCARALDPMSAFVVVNSAVRRSLDPTYADDSIGRLTAHELTSLASDGTLSREAIEQLDITLQRCRGHGLSSIGRVQHLVEPRLESALESLSWWRFASWGGPMPEPQVWIQGASGRRYRVDFTFGRVIGEADGAVKYVDSDSLWSEKQRQTDLELAGYSVVRWGWREMWHEPHLVAAALRRAAA